VFRFEIEIGPKDIEKHQVVLVNRINRNKLFVKREELITTLEKLLDEIQQQLLNRALDFIEKNTHEAHDFDELAEIIENRKGLVKSGWCESPECETKVKERTAATIRVILEEKDKRFNRCPVCGNEAKHMVLFAKAY